MAGANDPKTLREAIIFFADYDNCRKAVEAIRWPDGKVTCPTCGSQNVTYLETQRRYKCYAKHPRAQFSLKVGTIFEDSALGFEKWLPALWLLTNCKNGISSYELARALGVTQKSAWFMLSRLRLALQVGTGGKFRGDVEVDETFIGGAARFMHGAKKKRVIQGKTGTVGKVAVMGLLERHGENGSQVRTRVLGGLKRKGMHAQIADNVEVGSSVYTDAFRSYIGLENFWSLLKRAIKGTYVSIEPFHLFRYLDEQSFRFNNRKMTDASRFALALKGIINKRLTYTALTGSELPQTC